MFNFSVVQKVRISMPRRRRFESNFLRKHFGGFSHFTGRNGFRNNNANDRKTTKSERSLKKLE